MLRRGAVRTGIRARSARAIASMTTTTTSTTAASTTAAATTTAATASATAASLEAATVRSMAMARARREGCDLGQHLEGYRGDRQLPADVRLDVRQRDHVLLTPEADRIAFGPGARGATDAMHVVLGILGQVVIEDVA